MLIPVKFIIALSFFILSSCSVNSVDSVVSTDLAKYHLVADIEYTDSSGDFAALNLVASSYLGGCSYSVVSMYSRYEQICVYVDDGLIAFKFMGFVNEFEVNLENNSNYNFKNLSLGDLKISSAKVFVELI